jgi:hypothetical protein
MHAKGTKKEVDVLLMRVIKDQSSKRIRCIWHEGSHSVLITEIGARLWDNSRTWEFSVQLQVPFVGICELTADVTKVKKSIQQSPQRCPVL